jgi:hypothetical protein
MSGELSFCEKNVKQTLRVLGTVIGDNQDDIELIQAVGRLKRVDLLEKDVDFANRVKLGEFLIDEQNKFKAGSRVLNKSQMVVLDQALYDILGRRLCS